MKIKVSVIIPTYKRTDTLERAIKSVINQTYLNTEIVVVDDNEPDSEFRDIVRGIISKLQQEFTNLIYIKNIKNLGSAKTRNSGISNASGQYITFLDDDDIYQSEKIKNQLNYMLSNDLEMCFTDLVLKNKKDKIVDIRKRNDLTSFDKNTLLKYHLMYHITGTATFMYKSVLLKKIGGFDPIDIGDEFYLMVKTIEKSSKIGYLSGCDIVAYIHSNHGGLSTGENKITGENTLYNFKKEYFNLFSSNEIRYIKFRHYAVLTYANLKRRKYFLVLRNAVCAFINGPFYTIKILKKL